MYNVLIYKCIIPYIVSKTFTLDLAAGPALNITV